MKENYVIGIDFGTDSVRALVVNANTGEHSGTAVAEYTRWKRESIVMHRFRNSASIRSTIWKDSKVQFQKH